MKATPLYIKWRPDAWEQVIGQPKIQRQVSVLRNRGGFGRHAFWISGKSGTGKTTIAYLIAHELAEPYNVREVSADELTAGTLRQIEMDFRLYAFGELAGRALIINEAHGLRRDTIRELLVWLEKLPEQTCVIFTTTVEGQLSLFEDKIDASPLVSRCIELTLTNQGISKPLAKRAKEIALAEGLDGKPIAAYMNLVADCNQNMRRVLEHVNIGEMIA